METQYTAISVRFLLKMQSTKQNPHTQTRCTLPGYPALLPERAAEDWKAIYVGAETLTPRGLIPAQKCHSSVCIIGSSFQKVNLLGN